MKLVLVDQDPGVAGHSRDTAAIAMALAEAGHEVTLMYPMPWKTCFYSTIESVELMEVPLKKTGLATLADELLKIHHARNLDGVFVFEYIFDQIFNNIFAQLDLAFVGIKCAGPRQSRRPQFNAIVSFGREFRDGCIEDFRIHPCQIWYTPARLWKPESHIIKSGNKVTPTILQKIFSNSQDCQLIGSVARIGGDYAESIVITLLAVARLLKDGHNIAYVHIGTFEDPAFRRIKKLFEHVNEKFGQSRVACDESFACEPEMVVKYAKIICGSGRASIEGLLRKQSVIITGQTGEPEIVTLENFERLASFNFTTRSKAAADRNTKKNMLSDALLEITKVDHAYTRNQLHEKSISEFAANKAVSILEEAIISPYATLTTGRKEKKSSKDSISNSIKATIKKIAPKAVSFYRKLNRSPSEKYLEDLLIYAYQELEKIKITKLPKNR
jgi:hypothetical protein